jgi:hypothetical protein
MQGNREIFRAIDGYANYEVSTHGRVRNATTAKILKPGIRKDGYQQVGLCKDEKRKFFLIHRLTAQEFIENPNNKPLVDHIDNNPANNCVENLRWATGKENQGNSLKRQNTSSNYKGVTFNKRANKWQAQIQIDDKRKYLGLFDHEKDAARAYNEAAKHHFCEYALLNDISSDDSDEDDNDDSENEL